MERQKRAYPAKQNRTRWLSGVLLLLSAVIVVTGLFSRGESNGFTLETMPSPTAVPLDEGFDETLTTAEVKLPPAAWYALQVGVFENEELADQSAEAFRKRGAAGYIWHDGRYRVLAAAYPSKEDAQQVRGQLSDQHSIDCYLYAIEMPEISLRICGMQGQLEILQAAFAHIHDLVSQLQVLSVAMDRQELSAAEACEQLEGLNTQMSVVSLRLKQRFAYPVHNTVQALMKCFDAYAVFCGELSENESMIALGMKLKYQTLAMLQQIQEVYDTLSHT